MAFFLKTFSKLKKEIFLKGIFLFKINQTSYIPGFMFFTIL